MPEPKVKRYVLTPWKVSLSGSFLSFFFAVPYATWTGVQELPLFGSLRLPTAYLVLLIASASILWAILGVIRRNREGNLSWCILAIFLSGMSIALVAIASLTV
jgi:hypothetical protein